MPAVYLRVKVLETQNRKPEMEAFLDSLANGTTSIEQAEEIETLAQQKSLETVRQHALEKQAALTTDPVTRLQIRYALIRLYESRKDFTAAQKNVEALYRENPKILGVVRSTVDFYWRMKMQPQAIRVLLQAAKDAYPALGAQFTYEAARKSTEAKQFQPARDLLAGLVEGFSLQRRIPGRHGRHLRAIRRRPRARTVLPGEDSASSAVRPSPRIRARRKLRPCAAASSPRLPA